MNDKELMLRAIKLSEESVKNGGGPFGAVIARKAADLVRMLYGQPNVGLAAKAVGAKVLHKRSSL